MKRFHKIKHSLVLFWAISLGFISAPAQAILIEWELNDGIFNDSVNGGNPGIATGSFVWDTDIEEAISWNFATSGGDTATFSPNIYTSDDVDSRASVVPESLNSEIVSLIFRDFVNDQDIRRDLRFGIASPALLADVSMPIDLITSLFAADGGLEENFNAPRPRRNSDIAFLTGTEIVVSVNEPGTLSLVMLCGAGLMLARRRKSSS